MRSLQVGKGWSVEHKGNRNLEGFRILDCTDEPGHLAGKLLAELGAEVIKIEPPAGDPVRRRGPFVGGAEDPERSVPWLAMNTSKLGVTLDLNAPPGRATFLDLVATADALLECAGPDAVVGPLAHGIDETALRTANPQLVLCRLSPFGLGGPYAQRRGSDLTVLALGGNLYPTGNPDRAPVRCVLPVSHFHGGIELATAAAFALWGRQQTGVAETVDVSLQECLTVPNMTTPMQFPFTGFKGKRVGGGFRGAKAFFRELWPCKDGWISFALRGGPARNPGIQALVDYMRECGFSAPALERDWRQYNHNTITQEEVDQIEAALAAFFRTQTMEQLFRVACERNLLLAPAYSAREIARSGQLAAREFFVDIDDPGRGLVLRYPGAFAQTSLGPARVRGPAPRLGEHNDVVLGTLSRSPRTRASRVEARAAWPSPPALFRGLKILEFGGGAAGPLATRYFADHGATVVRVESRVRPDFIRLLRYTPGDPAGLDGSHMFAMVNVNKLGIALDLSQAPAREVALRLVDWCDVLAENFAPGTMAKWGLDYSRLAARKPALVMVSTCLNGQTGPERNYPGFGGQGSALAGFNYLTGWPDREPLGPYGTITDSLSPRFVALLVASALIHRERTGRGQYIDLSQVEAGIVCLSENILTYTATGTVLERCGNRSRFAAPHGVFRCAPEGDDDDRWLALAIHSDSDWQRLCDAMGNPEWSRDPRFSTLAGRLRYVDELERRIEEWTRTQSARALADTLVRAGLDAAVVWNFAELLEDPQLAYRNHYRSVDHPVIGRHLCETNAIRFAHYREALDRPAPRLGEHTEYVCRELLGMTDAEFRALAAAGVFA